VIVRRRRQHYALIAEVLAEGRIDPSDAAGRPRREHVSQS
jgi:hypothetical protein